MDPLNIPAKFEVRSFTRSWDNRGYSKNFGSLCIRSRSIFSQIFYCLLFARTLWIYQPNLTFVALPIPEIIGGTWKSWESLDSHAPYSPKCVKGFCSDGPCEYTRQVRSFTRSWNNRGYFKNLGSPCFCPSPLFSQIFKGLLFAWTLWIYLTSLKFVALPLPEIIWGTQKNWDSPWIRPRSLFSKIFHGFVFGWTLWMYRLNLQSVALAVPEIMVTAVLGWGCDPPILGKRRP